MRPPTLMSFSQLIHRFTCKWLLKGYWLRLPSACTYHANVMLSDAYRQEISGLRNRKAVKKRRDLTAGSLIDCAASHYQQNKVLITLPCLYPGCTHLLIMKQASFIQRVSLLPRFRTLVCLDFFSPPFLLRFYIYSIFKTGRLILK